MRFTWLHLAFFIALFSGITVNGERYAVLPRQNSSPSPSSSAASTAPTSSATASTNSHDSAQPSNGGSSTSASASPGLSNTPSSASQAAGTTLSTSTSGKNLSPMSETTPAVSATPVANITSPLPANGKVSIVHLRLNEMAKTFRHGQRRLSSATYPTKDYTSSLCGWRNTNGNRSALYTYGN